MRAEETQTERGTGPDAKRETKRLRLNLHKPTTTITLLGAGRLGTALALALARRGYRIEAVVARRLGHARRAARLFDEHTQSLPATRLDSLPTSQILLITTPDDLIEATAKQLAASSAAEPFRNQGRRTALHASGALSSDILSPLRQAGFSIGSMHPLVSISSGAEDKDLLRGAYYCVEGDRPAVRVARRLVRDLQGQSFSINREDKALYHAAAVLASGHMVALFDIALGMLKRCGLTEKRAHAVLLPLVESVLRSLSARSPARALTGTFARADVATMLGHLDALRSPEMKDALEAYRVLGRRSLRLAEQSGVDVKALKKMGRALKKV